MSINQGTNDEHRESETFNYHAISSSLVDEKEAQKIEQSVVFSFDLNIEELALNPLNKQEIESEDASTTDSIELSKLQQNPLDDQDYNKYTNGSSIPFSNTYELVESAQNLYPEGSREKYGEEKWSTVFSIAKNGCQLIYNIRNQPRKTLHELGQEEGEIELHHLKQECENTVYGEKYWFHTTNWENAPKIIEVGPKFHKKLSDFSVNGAFYLNPSYIDSYQWSITNNSKFNGYHAMLIYKFDPEKISKKGEELTEQQWKRLIPKRSRGDGKRDPEWSYVYQSANPKENAIKQKARLTTEGEYAMQLVIRSKKMCQKLQPCLVGCVYYQNVAIRQIPDQHQFHSQSTVSTYTASNDNNTDTQQEEKDDSNDELNVDSADIHQMAEHHSKYSRQPKNCRNGCEKSKQKEIPWRKLKHKGVDMKNIHYYTNQ